MSDKIDMTKPFKYHLDMSPAIQWHFQLNDIFADLRHTLSREWPENKPIKLVIEIDVREWKK